jgi:hypothetical protein
MNNRTTTIIGWLLMVAISVTASYESTKQQISNQSTRITVLENIELRSEKEKAEEKAERKELSTTVQKISENVIEIKGALNLKQDRKFK